MYTQKISFILIQKIYTAFVLFTLAFSVLVAVFGFNIFEKAGRKKYECFIPIYNLVVLMQISKISIYMFFLLFIPGANIIFIFYILYKLGKCFNVSNKFIAGLIFLPIVFIPILSFSDYNYEQKNQKKDKMLVEDNYLLMTQEQINKLNEINVSDNKVDNVFKDEIIAIEEKPTPYKSKKNNEIEKIEIVELNNVTKEEDKIEIVEL